jgi:F0F1-type ATP synthase assembly protein I
MDVEKNFDKLTSSKEVDKSIGNVKTIMRSMRVYNISYLVAPLLIFLPIGHFLDRYFNQRRTFLLIFTFISFIIGQIILWFKILRISKKVKNRYKSKKLKHKQICN